MIRLSADEVTEHSQWCGGFIEHRCIFRSPPRNPLLISITNKLNMWQYFLGVALLNQEFCSRLGLLFWNHYGEAYEAQPFQICGCESGGVALALCLQASAYQAGVAVNVFAVRKKAKSYALHNWFEGIVDENLPVMVVDDSAGVGSTIRRAAQHVAEAGLKLYPEAYAVLRTKGSSRITIVVEDELYPITTSWVPTDFARSHDEYVTRYGREPFFHGIVV